MSIEPLALKAAECGQCPIRHRAVCSRCTDDELDVLNDIKYYRTYDAGQHVVWAGDQMDFVGSVVDGIATVTQTLEDGRTQMIGLLLPSDFVGRPGRALATYDVVANSPLVMCCFRRKPFEKLMETTPNVGNRLLEMTLDELDAAREWMLLLGRKSAREKIASLLAILARRNISLNPHMDMKSPSFDLPLTREAMADYLGLTLETVSRQISALKRDNVIALEGKRHVIVSDFDRLLAETGDDTDGGLVC